MSGLIRFVGIIATAVLFTFISDFAATRSEHSAAWWLALFALIRALDASAPSDAKEGER
jgi:hypothetical protein